MKDICKLHPEIADRILKADEYQNNGDPYKDALEPYDINELIGWAACMIKLAREEDD